MTQSSKNNVQEVFIRDKDIAFRLKCPNCESQEMEGSHDMNLMYYLYLCVNYMSLSEDKVIRIKSPERRVGMLKTLALMLGPDAVGWEVCKKLVQEETIGEKNPRNETIIIYEFRRILK